MCCSHLEHSVVAFRNLIGPLQVIYGVVINSAGPINSNPTAAITRPAMIKYRGFFCMCVCVCVRVCEGRR